MPIDGSRSTKSGTLDYSAGRHVRPMGWGYVALDFVALLSALPVIGYCSIGFIFLTVVVSPLLAAFTSMGFLGGRFLFIYPAIIYFVPAVAAFAFTTRTLYVLSRRGVRLTNLLMICSISTSVLAVTNILLSVCFYSDLLRR